MLIKTKHKLATSLRVFLFPWSIRHSQFPWLYLKQYTTTVYLSRGTGHLMWTYHPLEVKDREWSLQTNIILQYMQLWLQRFFFNWLMLWFLSCCSETRHWTMAFSLPTEPTTKKKNKRKKPTLSIWIQLHRDSHSGLGQHHHQHSALGCTKPVVQRQSYLTPPSPPPPSNYAYTLCLFYIWFLQHHPIHTHSHCGVLFFFYMRHPPDLFPQRTTDPLSAVILDTPTDIIQHQQLTPRVM